MRDAERFVHANTAVATAPLVPEMSVLGAMLLISGFLVVAAILSQFGLNTRNKLLEEISP